MAGGVVAVQVGNIRANIFGVGIVRLVYPCTINNRTGSGFIFGARIHTSKQSHCNTQKERILFH